MSDDELALIREEAARIADDWAEQQPTEPTRKEADAEFVRAILRLCAPIPQADATPKYEYAQPGSPLFDGAEAYQQHLEAEAERPQLPAWFDAFLTNVCEIPDRNSPDGEPEAVVATLEELKSCALNAIESMEPDDRSTGICFFCGEPMDGTHEQDCPQANASANVAQGWQMVPIEPTEAMCEAYLNPSMSSWRQRYAAMLAASPVAPSANVAQGAEAFPYQKTFNAIAAATSISGGHVAISVAKFVEAFGAAPPAQTALTDELQAEVERLNAIINTPHADDFLRAVSIEAEHQRQRWGAEGDAGKTPADWFWLVGHLAGKALHAHAASNAEKAEHHVITSAAALANWHRNMLGNTDMRPGIDGDAALTAAQSASGDTK